MAHPKPTDRSRYSLFRALQTRWQDVDIYGHVNNVVYFSYFDTAINGWYLEAGLLAAQDPKEVFLVVNNQAQFFSEIRFPDEIFAGIGVSRLGSSSVTYEIALFRNDEQSACALGSYTHVLVDHADRTPVPISGLRRDHLEKLTLESLDG